MSDSKIPILFLGGAGFIGSNIIKELVFHEKFDIHVLEPDFANVQRLENLNVLIHRGCLSDNDKIYTILVTYNIRIVVHLVSTLTPGSQYVEFENEFQNVVFPTIQLMHICAEKKIKFVYFSSGGTVYGNRTFIKPFSEKEHLAPISHYGWLKQMTENSIQFIHRTKGLDYLILRPSNPYGPGQGLFGKQGFIAVAIGKILKNDAIEVWGDGSSIRDYIYIDDLCGIVCELINRNVNNMTLNIGSGVGASVNDIISILQSVAGDKVKVEYKSARSVDVSSVILDTKKLQSLVSYKLTPLDEGIAKFYAYSNQLMF
jgi:UDP-glucose 4-epimerase